MTIMKRWACLSLSHNHKIACSNSTDVKTLDSQLAGLSASQNTGHTYVPHRPWTNAQLPS